MFPGLRLFLKSYKTIFRNRDEFFSLTRMIFRDHSHEFDKDDPRSFIDAFLVRQQEVIVFSSGVTLAYCLFGLINSTSRKNSPFKEEM